MKRRQSSSLTTKLNTNPEKKVCPGQAGREEGTTQACQTGRGWTKQGTRKYILGIEGREGGQGTQEK